MTAGPEISSTHAVNTATAKSRVFVVEDHPLMRRSIIAAFEREADLTVCGEAEDARPALEAILALRPDLLVTDLQLKSSNGIDLISALRARSVRLPIVATTLFSLPDSESLARAAGASAFVPKNHGPEQLIVAARALLHPGSAQHGPA